MNYAGLDWLGGEAADADRASLAVLTHLSRIERHRPLDSIENPDQRAAAGAVRNWFKEELLDALVE